MLWYLTLKLAADSLRPVSCRLGPHGSDLFALCILTPFCQSQRSSFQQFELSVGLDQTHIWSPMTLSPVPGTILIDSDLCRPWTHHKSGSFGASLLAVTVWPLLNSVHQDVHRMINPRDKMFTSPPTNRCHGEETQCCCSGHHVMPDCCLCLRCFASVAYSFTLHTAMI